MKLEIEVDVRDETVDKKQLEAHLRKEAILALFADRKMPSGQAARELGLKRMEVLELLPQRGIPYVDYTFEDWQDDVKSIQRLWPEIEKTSKDPGAGRFK